MKKKLLALILAGIMALSLVACGGSKTEAPAETETPAETEQPAETPEADGPTYTVGICQLVQHVALDAATEGFIDALNEELGEGTVTFDNQNASNDIPMCSTIVNQFVSANVDLIMANATPALQAASAATVDIPILGTSVTEYGVAMGIENFDGLVGGNVSGTSDLAPLSEQAAMIKEWFPDAKTVGLLYCSAEANSQYQVDVITGYLQDLGLTVTPYSFTDTNDVTSVAQLACESSDVIYIPTDNTAASNTEAIANVVLPAKIPVIAGEAGLCKGCGVATLSLDYYDLGVATGKMAAKILKGEANVAEMPIEYAPVVTKLYNAANCEALGIAVPEGYEPLG